MFGPGTSSGLIYISANNLSTWLPQQNFGQNTNAQILTTSPKKNTYIQQIKWKILFIQIGEPQTLA